MQAAKGKSQGLSFPMGPIPAGLLVMSSLLLLLSLLFFLLVQVLSLLVTDLLLFQSILFTVRPVLPSVSGVKLEAVLAL